MPPTDDELGAEYTAGLKAGWEDGKRAMAEAVSLLAGENLRLRAIEAAAIRLCEVVPPESFPDLRAALGIMNPPGRK